MKSALFGLKELTKAPRRGFPLKGVFPIRNFSRKFSDEEFEEVIIEDEDSYLNKYRPSCPMKFTNGLMEIYTYQNKFQAELFHIFGSGFFGYFPFFFLKKLLGFYNLGFFGFLFYPALFFITSKGFYKANQLMMSLVTRAFLSHDGKSIVLQVVAWGLPYRKVVKIEKFRMGIQPQDAFFQSVEGVVLLRAEDKLYLVLNNGRMADPEIFRAVARGQEIDTGVRGSKY